MHTPPTAISHGALTTASARPAAAATAKLAIAAVSTDRGAAKLRSDQPQRPGPHVVGAADAVGVVVGVVDPDDHRDRDDQRQQRLPPRRGAQPGRGAGSRDHRGDGIGQRTRAGPLDPLRDTGHGRHRFMARAPARRRSVSEDWCAWTTDSARAKSARTPCRRPSSPARRRSVRWPRSSPPPSRTSSVRIGGLATDVFEIRDGVRRASERTPTSRRYAQWTDARSHRRQRLLLVLRLGRAQHQPRHPVRRAERADHGGHRRRPRGGVPAAAWRQPRVLAAHRARTGPTCGRCARWACGGSSGRARSAASTPELGPGAMVVPDQLVDRTRSREDTYFDSGGIHVGFADPYCPTLRAAVTDLPGVVDGGTMVVVQGPRFSTRAESQWFARQGFTLVNMTGYPEAVLARELEMCYAAIALVTDVDAGCRRGRAVCARWTCSPSSSATWCRSRSWCTRRSTRSPRSGCAPTACRTRASSLPFDLP